MIQEDLVRLSPIRFLPDHPLYPLISIKEKFDHLRQPTLTKKALFDVILSGKKIKEAYLLAQKNNFSKVKDCLVKYQTVNQRLEKELDSAKNQGQKVFDVEKILAESLERHLRIIAFLASKNNEENFRLELSKSIQVIQALAKLLEKDLPDASTRILEQTSKIKII